MQLLEIHVAACAILVATLIVQTSCGNKGQPYRYRKGTTRYYIASAGSDNSYTNYDSGKRVTRPSVYQGGQNGYSVAYQNNGPTTLYYISSSSSTEPPTRKKKKTKKSKKGKKTVIVEQQQQQQQQQGGSSGQQQEQQQQQEEVIVCNNKNKMADEMKSFKDRAKWIEDKILEEENGRRIGLAKIGNDDATINVQFEPAQYLDLVVHGYLDIVGQFTRILFKSK